MSFSFDETLSSRRDEVRFYIGDADSHQQLLSNEEVSACIAQANGKLWRACYYACLAISAKNARRARVYVQGQSANQEQVWRAYRTLAIDFLHKARTQASLFSGGISVSKKEEFKDDSDLTKPGIRVGMTDAVDESVHRTTNTYRDELA